MITTENNPIQLTRNSLLEFIKSRLDENNKGIWKLENEAGVTKDSIRDFLRGKVWIPRPDKLKKILYVLGYDLIIVKRKP